jgi:hypothetical protein
VAGLATRRSRFEGSGERFAWPIISGDGSMPITVSSGRSLAIVRVKAAGPQPTSSIVPVVSGTSDAILRCIGASARSAKSR